VNQLTGLSVGRVRLRLLGGFTCTLDDRAVAGIAYDKMRALLAYLAVEPARDHRREVLAELLWSSSNPQTARANLRRTLSDLRRVLGAADGPELFFATKSTIRFIPNAIVDVVEFTAPARSSAQDEDSPAEPDQRLVDLYAGEFMAGFYLPECPDFEEWLLVRREALHRRALALLERLGSLHEGRDDPAKALPFALRCAELDPWNEAAHRRVMRLYAACGQNAAGLKQYELCRDLLHKELGAIPAPETRHLAERIRNAEFVGSPVAGAVASAPVGSLHSGERRQATVLFCELMPCGIDDPDEAMERLLTPRARCVELIRSFSGFVVLMHGGGLLGYFGYPRSHEGSAVRALRAALAVLQEAADGVEVRAGVHTGLILTGKDPSLPDTVGKTSGTAIQLRRCVDYGQVAISRETQRLVAGYFEFRSLGARTLPDLPRPLEVFSVIGESGARTRLDAAVPLTPLVGRKDELAKLTAWWNAAKRGTRQTVLVQGEPAIGKSRLMHAFKLRLADDPHVLRELRCFPEYNQSPFYPLLALLEADIGFAPGEHSELRSAKLASHVAAVYPSWAEQAVPLLLSLYSLPQGTLPAPILSPQEQKLVTMQFMRAMLMRSAQRLPVLLIVEDLHWADPSTLDLLGTLHEGDRAAGSLLSIFTGRPGDDAPCAASVLPLGPLSASETGELIAALERGLSTTRVLQIVERADGVPLFAEELAKSAAEGDRADIPATLQDVLAARIDALGDAKPTAQFAATIGRQFSVDLLCRASARDTHALDRTLGVLMQAGLILYVDEATCQFKHSLVREAAYQSQTRSDRRMAHRQIAEVLQGEANDSVAALPELVAQHLFAAGDIRRSVGYWVQAGHRAIAASANLEAIAHLELGLRALLTLPPAPERNQEEFSILLSLCAALHATQGYGCEDSTRVTTRICALREQGLAAPDVFLAEWARLRNTMASVGPSGLPEAATKLLSLARDDVVKLQAAHYAAAVACFWLGEFKASSEHAEEAISQYQQGQHHLMLGLFGEDLSVSFAGHLSWALCFLGFPDQALAWSARAIQQARGMDHPKTLAMALLFATMLRRWLNMHEQTLSFSAETIALTREHGMAHWTATAEALRGKAEVMHRGRQDLSDLHLITARLSAAAPSYAPLRLADMAEMHMHLELYDEALVLLAQSETAEASTSILQFAAERHRLEGVCFLAGSRPDAQAAQSCFEQALTLSRGQGAKLLELRASVSMARLWQQQGKQAKAREMLESILGWFTEGVDTPDLLEAAVLLKSLSPSERA
jgi:DNA-binding SARP family transcriptional activator/tetratricopeptide (TPR) repeat protein